LDLFAKSKNKIGKKCNLKKRKVKQLKTTKNGLKRTNYQNEVF